jgi:hypothetical protein
MYTLSDRRDRPGSRSAIVDWTDDYYAFRLLPAAQRTVEVTAFADGQKRTC